MALKKYKPITAGTRWRIGNAYAEITTDTPEKSLLEKVKSTAGRNAQGQKGYALYGRRSQEDVPCDRLQAQQEEYRREGCIDRI